MYIHHYLLLVFWIFFPVMVQGQASDPFCRPFYEVLKELPNGELALTTGTHTSIADGREYEGCEVRFSTSDTLVTNNYRFLASWIDEDSRIYQQGWRINDWYAADGPGSMLFGLEKLDKLCIILESQPATLEEEPGSIAQSETLEVVVQCRQQETRQRKVFVTAMPVGKQDRIQRDSIDWSSPAHAVAAPVRTDVAGNSRSRAVAQASHLQQHPKRNLAPVTDPEDNSCGYFYEQLKDIPHKKLDRHSGEIIFSRDNKRYSGCSVRFVTSDSLLAGKHQTPSFWPKSNAYLYRNGWRHNLNYDSDGPGTSAFGIEKGETLCLIAERQPATLVEPGKIEWVETITLTVECIERQK